jgi:hypothetical protein
MDGIGNSEDAESLGLELKELWLAVVHRSRHITVFPPGVVHFCQGLKLLYDSLFAHALFRKSQVSRALSRYHFRLQFG